MAGEEPVVVEVLVGQHQEDDVIQLRPSDLAGDDVFPLIESGQVHLQDWVKIAEYYRKNAMWDKLTSFLKHAYNQQQLPLNDPHVMKARNRLLVMLAMALLEQAKKSEDQQQSKLTLNNAMTITDQVAKYDRNNLDNLVCQGYIHLYMGSDQLKFARAKFALALAETGGFCIPALMGQAAVDFHSQEYVDALRNYRTVLRMHPNCPPFVRVAIGICFTRLKRPAKARAAFSRALALDPENVTARVGLAILHINERTTPAMIEAAKLLEEAYKREKVNQMAINLLGNYFVLRKEYKKAQLLLNYVASKGTDTAIKAQSYHHLARIEHAQGNLDRAMSYYYQAVTLSPSYLPAHFGHGQTMIHKKQYRRARECFETVYKNMPNNMAAMKILACLYLHEVEALRSTSSQEKATVLFEKLLKKKPEDIEAWLALGMLLIRSDTQRGMEVFEEAKSRIEKLDGQDLPPELMNNLACLNILNDQPSNADKLFHKAISQLKLTPEEEAQISQEDAEFINQTRVTIQYNMGRLYESTFRLSEAIETYKSILQEYPDYSDCRLRLGIMARNRGNVREATTYFKECRPLSQVTALTCLGNQCIEKRQYDQAKQLFDRIISIRKKDGDIYSLLALGNIYYLQNRLKDAKTLYIKALQASSENVYAVNGLGCVLAASGKATDAKNLFQLIREAGMKMEGFDQVLINLAHTYIDLGLHSEGIALYEYCRKLPGRTKSSSILGALGRAYYKSGNYALARRYFCKERHLDPRDTRCEFDIAISLQQEARQILDKQRLLPEELQHAERALTSAYQSFDRLRAPKTQVKYNYDRAAKLYRSCRDMHKQLESREKMAAQEAEKLSQQKDISRVFNNLLEQREKEKEQRLQLSAEEEAERRRLLDEMQEKLPSIESINEKTPQTTRKSRSRKKQEDFISDDDDDVKGYDSRVISDQQEVKREPMDLDPISLSPSSERRVKRKKNEERSRRKRTKNDQAMAYHTSSDEEDPIEGMRHIKDNAMSLGKSKRKGVVSSDDDGGEDGDDEDTGDAHCNPE